MSLLQLRQVSYQAGATSILLDLNLEVKAGEFVSVLGPSGCGKTTLLRLIGGLLPDYQGQILVDGFNPQAGNPSLAFVFQTPRLLPWRTALENVQLPLDLRPDQPSAWRRQQAREYLELVGLGGMADRYPAALSGGEKQRVALARALITKPRLLLCDEPLVNLDLAARQSLRQELVRLWRHTSQTVILVTHDPAEAVYLSTRLVVLGGKPTGVKAELAGSPSGSATSCQDPLELERSLIRLLGVEGGEDLAAG